MAKLITSHIHLQVLTRGNHTGEQVPPRVRLRCTNRTQWSQLNSNPSRYTSTQGSKSLCGSNVRTSWLLRKYFRCKTTLAVISLGNPTWKRTSSKETSKIISVTKTICNGLKRDAFQYRRAEEAIYLRLKTQTRRLKTTSFGSLRMAVRLYERINH